MSGIMHMLIAAVQAAAATTDAFFKYVTLLLPGNGTNGAQNNTFLDSSTNNFSITRNGNTTQGTFSPYGANWSNYFDGSGDGVSFGSNVNTNPSSSDITVEAWVFPLAYNSYGPIFSNDINNGFHFGKIASGFGVRHYGIGDVISTATTPTLNQWTHVAVSRSGNTWYLFYNGTQVATATASNTFTQGPACVGGNATTAAEAWNGYLSNVRFVKGTALYTSNFTPSTTPLTAVTNTQLLTCQSNRFSDKSSNAYTATAFGTPSVQRFSPFSPTAPYSSATIGGSGYFDGSGDYLTGPANSAPLSFGTGDFTIESWVYPTSFANANSTVFAAYGPTTGAYILFLPSSGYPNFYVYSSGGLNGNIFATPSTKLALNAWSHLAVTRASGVFRLFINGVLIDSFTNTTANINATTSNNCSVGAYFQAGMALETTSPISGYVSDVRVVKGTAVYTAAFTPPTAPLTAITNTSLLINGTNGGIIDNAMMNDLETVGNAQISTAVSKFGGSSMYFNGTTDYLTRPGSTLFDFGTGDFTVEAWVYPSATQAQYACIVCQASTGNSWYLSFSTSNVVTFTTYALGIVSSSSSLSNSVWTHVAVSRSGGTMRMFFNGVQVGSAPDSTSLGITAKLNIGFNGVSHYFNGYIDDLRITKGYARYTANFTPPTTAFPLN